MISLGRLSDRNYGCRQRPRYLIFSQFSIGPILLPKCVCLRGSASDPTGGLPAPPAGKRWVSPLQRAPQNCGPQGPETPRSATVWGDRLGALWGDRLGALWGDRLGALWGDRLGALWGDRLGALWGITTKRQGCKSKALYICKKK